MNPIKIEKQSENVAKISGYKKLFPCKNLKSLLMATLVAMIDGSYQPILGVVFAKLLSLLPTPIWYPDT
jgi:hypothetical protein